MQFQTGFDLPLGVLTEFPEPQSSSFSGVEETAPPHQEEQQRLRHVFLTRARPMTRWRDYISHLSIPPEELEEMCLGVSALTGSEEEHGWLMELVLTH